MTVEETAEDSSSEPTPDSDASTDQFGQVEAVMDTFVNVVELAAAALFAILFAIGVFDLGLQIAQATLAGKITDPIVVIGFIDVGLLLLIIVEVYQTVIAYVKENDTRRIVRLVIYTGVIAVVRKVIIYRTGEYNSIEEALLVAVAYGVLTLGLVALMYVDRRTTETSLTPER